MTLEFPSESIFIESKNYSKEDLIKHFIRGYFDGDGCLSYYTHDDVVKPKIALLGTPSFLTSVKSILKNYDIHSGNILADKRSNATYINIHHNFLSFIYTNSSIYLNRKYKKFTLLNFCRSKKKFLELLQTNIGEDCDVNPEITTETKESVAS